MFQQMSGEWIFGINLLHYKKGAAYLGAGFTIKPTFEDHIGSLKAVDPKTGKIKWNYKNQCTIMGWSFNYCWWT